MTDLFEREIETAWRDFYDGKFQSALDRAVLLASNGRCGKDLYHLSGRCLLAAGLKGPALDSLLRELDLFPENESALVTLSTVLRQYQPLPHHAREYEILDSLLPPKAFLADIGSNVGNSSEFFLERGHTVLSIEPVPFCIELQKKRFGNYLAKGQLRIAQAACSDSSHAGTLHLSVEAMCTFSTLDESYRDRYRGYFEPPRDEHIHVTRASTIIEDHSPGRSPDSVKIDCPGHVLAVLAGLFDGQNSLERPALLMIEIPSDTFAESQVTAIFELLRMQGYGTFKAVTGWGGMHVRETSWGSSCSALLAAAATFRIDAQTPPEVPSYNLFAAAASIEGRCRD